MLYFYLTSAKSGVKRGFSRRVKKRKGRTKKNNVMLSERPTKCGAFHTKVRKMAQILKGFLGGKSHIFVGNWVEKLSRQILFLKKIGKLGKLPTSSLQTSRYKSVPVSAA